MQNQLYRLSWVLGNTLHPYDSVLSPALILLFLASKGLLNRTVKDTALTFLHYASISVHYMATRISKERLLMQTEIKVEIVMLYAN